MLSTYLAREVGTPTSTYIQHSVLLYDVGVPTYDRMDGYAVL